ncbi:MAG: multicopper oxidase family protein [Ectothiorhodospiraceae bacterium]|nr:multicopper oxidase family protein [Ectothiorhodospiraceae bacterium]
MSTGRPGLTRRRLLQGAAAAPLLAALPRAGLAASDGPIREYRLRAAPASVRLAAPPFPPSALWCYGGATPGPELRLRHGERLRVVLENGLDELTAVHWHGVRVPNEMDGISFLTQPPVEPGQQFVYEFEPPDAGTFWYHSHENAPVQQGRGLHGVIVVEERDPPRVDRDLVWSLDDWRLDRDAQIVDDFDSALDYSRAGRIGNTVTLNGRTSPELPVRAGERIRLRVVNSANARIFQLRFQGHQPTVIALDGQPVEPFQEPSLTLAPAQRADLVIDMSGRPGERFAVIDTFYGQNPFRVAELAYSEEPPLRESPLDAPIALAPVALPEPVLDDRSLTKEVLLEGGDLGRLRKAYVDGRQRGLSELILDGKFWAVCGVAGFRQVMPPFITAERGRTVVLRLLNRTAWPHTIHTHGHSFRIVSRHGREPDRAVWRDTVWLEPEEDTVVAFVADNPGDWLLHCHMLSHAYAGMQATFRVT